MQQALVDLFTDGPSRSGSASFKTAGHQTTLESIFRALDLVPTPILIGMNPESTDIRSNAAGRALFGESNENLSQSAPASERPNFHVFSDGREVAPDDLPMQLAGRSGLPVEATECELRFEDGAVKFIRGRAVPVFGRDGAVRGSIGVFLDVTLVREREQQHLLELDEIKHRAKNTLALVQAVANFTLKSKLDPAVYKEFEARLQVISQTVNVVLNDSGEQGFRQVVTTTLERQIGSPIDRVAMTGPEIVVPAKARTPLSMAIHELATNACKYGSLSSRSGVVTISWRLLDDGRTVVMEWTERGGPPVVAPVRRGFGSKLLSQISRSSSGRRTEVSYDPRGLQCRLYVGLT